MSITPAVQGMEIFPKLFAKNATAGPIDFVEIKQSKHGTGGRMMSKYTVALVSIRGEAR